MKRSASEIRDVKTAAPPGGLLFGTQNTDGELLLTRRPFIIERPIPIDRFTNYQYNKTVIENILKPTAFLLDYEDAMDDQVKQDY